MQVNLDPRSPGSHDTIKNVSVPIATDGRQPHLPYLHHPLMLNLRPLSQLRHQGPMPLLVLTALTHLIRHQSYPLSHESYQSIKW